MSSLKEIRKQLVELEGWLEKGDASNPASALSLLTSVKIGLTKLAALQPGVVFHRDHLPELEVARTAYEVGALVCVKLEDESGFERHVAQAKTYYVDYAKLLPKSERQTLMIGLNLVRLMAQNRIAEFHTELELVDLGDVRGDRYIRYAMEVESWVMEGSYSKMRDMNEETSEQGGMMMSDSCARSRPPHGTFGWFVRLLQETVQEQMAVCCERAYKSVGDAAMSRMLGLGRGELQAFCEGRGWEMRDGRVWLGSGEVLGKKMEDVPSNELIKRSLEYARELEQII